MGLVDTRKPAARAVTGMGAGDAVCLGGLVVLLLVMSYVQSRGRPFWSDEILGWVVLRQSTVGGMLRLWRAGLDGSGIWFFLFGRVWAGVFGASEVSLRMYSAVGVAAGAALVWAAARRFYALLPVAVSVTFVCAAARVMRWQLANARSYGWLLFGCGLVIFMIARGEEEQHWKPGKRFLVATFLAYSALAGGHLLAAIYVGALLGAQVGIDLLQRRWRPWMYTSAACSLVVVWFARANIVASAAVGKPYFWTVKPGMRDLAESTSALGRPIAASIGLLLLVGFLRLRLRRRRTAVYGLMGAFALLDALLWLYSQVKTSVYADRYLLPFTLVGMLAMCELFTQIAEADAPFARLRRGLPWAWVAAAGVFFFVPRVQKRLLPFPDRTTGLMAAIPAGMPVVDEDVASFEGMEFYGHPRLGEVIFPGDRELALDPARRQPTSGFNAMENWKAYGIYAEDIQTTGEILGRAGDFVVVAHPDDKVWLERRVLEDPRFAAREVGSYRDWPDTDLEIWVVRRVER